MEYERAVIFRLGRLVTGGAKGPGEPFFNNIQSERYYNIYVVVSHQCIC